MAKWVGISNALKSCVWLELMYLAIMYFWMEYNWQSVSILHNSFTRHFINFKYHNLTLCTLYILYITCGLMRGGSLYLLYFCSYHCLLFPDPGIPAYAFTFTLMTSVTNFYMDIICLNCYLLLFEYHVSLAVHLTAACNSFALLQWICLTPHLVWSFQGLHPIHGKRHEPLRFTICWRGFCYLGIDLNIK